MASVLSCSSILSNKPKLARKYYRLLLTEQEFLDKHTRNGFLFNGKQPEHVQHDFARDFKVTDDPYRGYGTYATKRIDLARSHGRYSMALVDSKEDMSKKADFDGYGISIFKINFQEDTRIMDLETAVGDRYIGLPGTGELRYGDKIKYVRERYGVDILASETGIVTILNPSVLVSPKNWEEYVVWLSQVLRNMKNDNDVEHFSEYVNTLYSRALKQLSVLQREKFLSPEELIDSINEDI